MRRYTEFGTAALALTVLAGCGESGPSGGEVSFNLATRPASAAAAVGAAFSATAAPETYTDGTNTLVITSAQLVAREIELERTEGVNCDLALLDDEDCDEELELGPVLIDLPLGVTGASRTFTVAVEPGTYHSLEIEIHKTESGSTEDAAFLQAHPDFEGVSIRVEGTYNGTPFVYTSDLDVEPEFEFQPALELTDQNGLEVTLAVDLGRWFRNGSGNLVDPASANKDGVNESLVDENVEQSFEAFEDEDRDGTDD